MTNLKLKSVGLDNVYLKPHLHYFHLFCLSQGSEDCLTLNVYSPDISPSAGLPVLVFVHDGDFVAGDSLPTNIGPHFLMDQVSSVPEKEFKRFGTMVWQSQDKVWRDRCRMKAVSMWGSEDEISLKIDSLKFWSISGFGVCEHQLPPRGARLSQASWAF